MKNKYKIALISSCVVLSLFSCKKELDKYKQYTAFDKISNTQWNPALAAPIIKAELSMADILAKNQNDVVSLAGDGLITLVYATNIVNIDKSKIQVPELNQNLKYDFLSPFPGVITFNVDTSLLFNGNEDIDFPTSPRNETVKEVIIKSGTLDIILNSNFPALTPNLDVQVTLPGLEINGAPYQLSRSLPTSGSTTISVNLKDAKLNLEGLVNDKNKMTLTYALTINALAGDQIAQNQGLGFDLQLKNIEWKSVIGDFKTQTFDVIKDSINLSIFTNATTAGNFRLTDPQLKVTITNGIGIPFQFNFDKFYSLNTATNDSFPLVFSAFPNPFPINSPISIGDSVKTILEINKTNTDIVNILSPTPRYLIFDIKSVINPGGGTNYNFISENSVFKVNAEVEMPLEGYLDRFDILDTFNFTLGQTLEELQEATISILVKNGIPLDAYLQLYLYDSKNKIIIDSLMKESSQIFVAGVPDNKGRVNQETVETIPFQIKLNQTTATNLLKSDQILLRANLNTYNAPNTSIKLYNDYTLGLQLGVLLKGSINLTGGEDN